MLIVRHLGTPNSDFNGCHCMRDPVLYRSMDETFETDDSQNDAFAMLQSAKPKSFD